MKRRLYTQFFLAMITTLGLTPALAFIDSTGPIPINSEEAFDAVATGCIDGVCYGVGKVVLVDTRTQAELDFQGGPARVVSIELKDGTVFTPDMGKAKVDEDGKFLEYTLDGKKKKLKVDKVEEVVTELIGKLAACSEYVPGEGADEGEFFPIVEEFSADMAAIADEMDAVGDGPNVAITMCNSGGRSTQCPLLYLETAVQARFAKWYEIDAAGDIYVTPPEFQIFVDLGLPLPPPNIHMAALGGYSGSDYGGDYNGMIGWPGGRQTQKQPVSGWKTFDPETGDVRFAAPSGPSVSWKDSGLPIYIPKVMCNLSP